MLIEIFNVGARAVFLPASVVFYIAGRLVAAT